MSRGEKYGTFARKGVGEICLLSDELAQYIFEGILVAEGNGTNSYFMILAIFFYDIFKIC